MTPGEKEGMRRLVARAILASEDRSLTQAEALALLRDLASGLACALSALPERPDRRARFAAAALTGIVSLGERGVGHPVGAYRAPAEAARIAAKYADALLAELDVEERAARGDGGAA